MALALRYPQADVAPDQISGQRLLILLEQSVKERSVGVVTRKTSKGSMWVDTVIPASSFPTTLARPCQAKHELLSLLNKLFCLLHRPFSPPFVSVACKRGGVGTFTCRESLARPCSISCSRVPSSWRAVTAWGKVLRI